MRLRPSVIGAAIGAAILAAPIFAAPAAAEGAHFIPLLTYRTGQFAPNGIPIANGFADYLTMLNERDGGINGVRIEFEECETGYANDRGVECYERLKNRGEAGATAVNPVSTGITYALIERATQDKIPVISMGYGRTDAANGRVFPYVFPIVATYWAQATAIVKYIAEQEGGYDKLDGKNIAHVYLDSAYGREPIPTFNALADRHGFTMHEFPIPFAAGMEQRSTWLQIGRRLRPDWVVLWGWGVMNSAAIQEAAAIGYPREQMIGNWWSSSEPDVRPAGEGAVGYRGMNMHGLGAGYEVHRDILEYVYDAGMGHAERDAVGENLYNRGVLNAMVHTEAIRTAMEKFGNKPIGGEEMQWGLENLELTEARLKELGFEGLFSPIALSCSDHEGGGKFIVQEWDGKQWKLVSDWMEADHDLVRPLIESSSAAYAKEKGIEARDCQG